MTIICVSHTHIAADGMKVWGSEIRGLDHKKLSVITYPNSGKKAILGYSGNTAMQLIVCEWYRQGADIRNVPPLFDTDDNWTLLAIDERGLFKLSSRCPYLEPFNAPMAIGTGQDMAIGAMYAGKTARDAVDLVCRTHTVCGGEIQEIDIMEVTGFTLAKPVPKSDSPDRVVNGADNGWAHSRQALPPLLKPITEWTQDEINARSS
jgi:hypothetical protein